LSRPAKLFASRIVILQIFPHKIQAYQVYVATDNHNPFKIKFLPADKPDLSKFEIGDIVEFERLEAFENKFGQLYFRANGIKKKGK